MRPADLSSKREARVWFTGEHAVPLPERTRSAWRVDAFITHTPFGVATWLVHCPHLHPAWSYWLVSLCHLRDVEGMPTAIITRPTSTHELLILALDPASPPDPDRADTMQPLQGPCVLEQFGPVTDDEARAALEELMLAVVRDELSPETEWRSDWHHRLLRLVASAHAARPARSYDASKLEVSIAGHDLDGPALMVPFVLCVHDSTFTVEAQRHTFERDEPTVDDRPDSARRAELEQEITGGDRQVSDALIAALGGDESLRPELERLLEASTRMGTQQSQRDLAEWLNTHFDSPQQLIGAFHAAAAARTLKEE